MAAAAAAAAGAPGSTDGAQGLLARSPPGQFDIVAKEIRGIVGADGFPDAAVAAAREAHLKSERPVLEVGKGHFVALCPEGQVGPGKFVDSKRAAVVCVDMVTGKPSEGGDGDGDAAAVLGEAGSPVRAAREAVVGELETYAGHAFSFRGTRHGAVEVFVSGEDLTVVLSGVKTRLDNFWAAQWQSTWTVSGAAGASPSLSGSVRVTTHYFEDGNVQLRAAKDFAAVPLKGAATPEKLAEAVRRAIADTEDAYQAALAAVVQSVEGETMRDLRRAMPLSGQPMAWNLNAHRFRRALPSAKSGAGSSS
ncbi:hypothetical protein FNF27_08203 [Cafeteria roenbergensis]|uniref:F-actin-capping protein subunit alpha n=1 Tax=Cafeteria roenbergensis TaxID=33653 RepID=A0A5A8CWJ4_CAFRO|nr:hypothetical protein FNF29_00983 [Cafeteria roenbergensis]KAA0161007.1 hypothetical protein FNF27_08203 [Cafeteria roenbergensis]|eukprot:KAA0156874.1 hypothetical protein FNF29_00983 [Cafeteria roenbergensis]